jgi:NADPH-dependent 2,4-dienoyl-CoA reductase/sulfur reductase-like enzyme
MSVSKISRWGQLFPLTALLLAPPGAIHAADTDSGPTVLRCDLAVVGGGSGGFGAALAAARRGLNVVLVERADCLGGNSVRGGVHCWEMGAGGTGIPLWARTKRPAASSGMAWCSSRSPWPRR